MPGHILKKLQGIGVASIVIRVDQSGASIHLVVADAEEGLGVDGEDHVAHLQPGLKQEPCITL